MEPFSPNSEFAFIRLENDDRIYLERLTPTLSIKFDNIFRLFKLNSIQYFDDYHYEWIIATFEYPYDRKQFLEIINFEHCPEAKRHEDYYDLVQFLDVDVNNVRNENIEIQKFI